MTAITIKQLRAFVEVYRCGKLGLAAQRLHVSPGALSMLIKQFEAELGGEVFDRSTRRLRPTQAAEAALPMAERVLADLHKLDLEVRSFHSLGQGRVSLAATPALAARVLPPVLKAFRDQHPGIRVVLEDCAPDALWSLVSSERCDFGIGSPDLRDNSLEWDVLLRDRISLICRDDDPLAEQRRLRWDVLRGREFITVKPGSGIRRLIDDTLAALKLGVAPAIEVSFLETALALTQQGLGVAVLPSYFVRVSERKGLVARPLVAPSVQRDILLLRRRGRSQPPAAERLREFLLQQVA